MNRLPLAALNALALVAAACSSLSPGPAAATAPAGASVSAVPAGVDPFAPPTGELVRVDQQGAVMVEIRPRELSEASNVIEFDVALNTHSADLSMDLALLSTLSTDTGLVVPAAEWDAPRGGHHVSGTLVFPARKDGRAILEGTSTLTLTIVNLDAPSRAFEWNLR